MLKSNHHDNVPAGFKRHPTIKGWLQPTATTLRSQRATAENKDLKSAIQTLTDRMAALEASAAKTPQGTKA